MGRRRGAHGRDIAFGALVGRYGARPLLVRYGARPLLGMG